MERVQAAAAIRPGIGAPIPRVEDLRLLTGRAAFATDRDGAGHAHAAFVRSPHAHARLAGIDSRVALRMPGVIAVFTAADLAGDGAGSLPAAPMLRQRDGQPMAAASWHLLASDRVRHVGDPVAMVVADSVPHAQDAAEAVRAGYEPLAAVVDARAAVAPGAPQVWHTASGNVAAWYECGDRAAVDAAFARAARVARVAVFNQRLAGVPLEPRAAICDFDPRARAWTLQCTSQHSHLVRNHIAESVLRVPREKLRVTVGDLGGGFGTKAAVYPEYALVAWAAGRLERTVRWEASRSESFVSDVQGRDLYTEAELALDGEGRFLALRVDSIANAGAYLSWLGPIIPTLAASRVIPGPYRTAAVHAVVRVVLTHTVPVEAYRGAGRPEYAYLMERLVEAAARSTGIDAIELRRRNLVARAQMPFRNALGDVYDSGDFPRVMQAALDASDGAGFAARRLEARARGCRLGRGMACYIESTGAANPVERVELVVEAAGRVRLLSGTQAMGQGLATSYAQIVAARLQLALEEIEVVQGDTARVRTGGGSGGSRSLFIGGSAAFEGAQALLETARGLAAAALEVAPRDLEYSQARFRVAGTDRSIGLFELAARRPGSAFSIESKTTVPAMSWPNGCHVCEAEIDEETGAARVTRFVAVDDVGVVVNPVIVHGQVHGGVAQGIGQALYEQCVFDPASGQPLAGSLLDYCLARADDVPGFEVSTDESSPCTTNALGAKGAGEGGAIGAPPAVVSALLDALASAPGEEASMPLTSEKLWRLLQLGRVSGAEKGARS